MPPTPPAIGESRVAAARVAVIATVVAWVAYVCTWLNGEFLSAPGLTNRYRAEAVLYLLVVTLLTASALAYLCSRLGWLYRARQHRRVPRAAIDDFFTRVEPTLTVIVPSYREERRVIRCTLLSAALQEYPHQRVVLLIDDPPAPTRASHRAALEAARALPGEIEQLLAAPRAEFTAALDAFESSAGSSVTAEDMTTVAGYLERAAAWLNDFAAGEEIIDHADQFFVDQVVRRLASDFALTASAVRAAVADGAILPVERIRQLYRRLVWTFRCELSSFERKQYASLNHDANKAMNLNSYIGLMGNSYQDIDTVAGRVLVPASPGNSDLDVPDPDYVLTLDADSVLLPEYCVRLVHLLEQSQHAQVAVAQTPYSAYPGSSTRLERLAGATTDLQYMQHQGMTHYGSTFWVGANAVLRKVALDQVCERSFDGNWEIRRYIRDRTVIEDTESTIDLAAHGWSLLNYPERLSYSATPPDFGALCIQRRRWANGGLLILPKLLRHRRQRRKHGLANPFGELFLRVNYMASIGWSSLSLLLLLAYPFRNQLVSPLLGLVAVPYFVAMASDLRSCGYKRLDAIRIYGFNLILLPINLVGVGNSIVQAITGDKSVFGRTPKVRNRTVPNLLFVVAPYCILALAAFTLYRDYVGGRVVNAAYAGLNVALCSYAIVAYIGVRNSIVDLWLQLVSRLYVPVRPANPSTQPVQAPRPVDWPSVLYFGGHGADPAPRHPVAAMSSEAAPPGAPCIDITEPRRRRPLARSSFRTVFQPVTDLATGVVVGHEALSRFDDGIGPADRLAAAAEEGRGVELEVLLAQSAIQRAAALPPGTWLAVNVSRELIRAGRVLQHAVARPPVPLVFEIDLSGIGADELESVVSMLPAHGEIALSGVTPDYLDLSSVRRIGPRYVKLSRSWVHELPADPARQALVSTLATLAGEWGCDVIAESIESDEQLAALRHCGVRLGQGFLLGRPTQLLGA